MEELLVDSKVIAEKTLKGFYQILLIEFGKTSDNIFGNILEKKYVIVFETGIF